MSIFVETLSLGRLAKGTSLLLFALSNSLRQWEEKAGYTTDCLNGYTFSKIKSYSYYIML